MSSSGNNSKPSPSKPSPSKPSPSKPSTSTGVRPRNPLDSTAPTPRGKERRNPKEKKPKALRKQLNKERNLLKLTMSDKAVVYRDADSILVVGKNNLFPHCSKGIIIGRNDSIAHSSQGSVTIVGENDGVPSTSRASVCFIAKNDRVPNSSKASICFIGKNDKVPSSSKASFCIIGKNDLIAHSSRSSVTTPDEIEPGAPRVPLITSIDPVINYEDVLSKRLSEIGLIDNVEALVHYTLHSSKHREYARQALTNEIEYSTYLILINLLRYQDRVFNKAPEKIETKRRYVCGFNQVNKYIRSKKVKAVVIAPDIEQIIVDGVLDEAVENLISMCQEKGIPIIFTSTRNRLAKVCSKTPRSHVSCLGIIDYSGVHDEFNKLIHFVEKARETYDRTQAMLVRYLENLPPSAFKEFYAYIREKNNLPCELQTYRQAIHTPLRRTVYSYIRLIKHSRT